MAEDYTYCVVEDVDSDVLDKDGLPIPTGSVNILFDGGFDEDSCHKWIKDHPECLSSPSLRVMSFMESE
jgi:hypothetical protein